MADITIALAGNPNVGKSTVFNALTGSRQHVGNWPGKTVEKKEGVLLYQGHSFTVVDLPGTYSLSAFSMEEQITREFLVEMQPAVVINVVDAANLERNLYLTAQILETGVPTIIVLNMQDQAAAQGLNIRVDQMSALLGGVPVIPMVASRNQGLVPLKEAVLAMTEAARPLRPAEMEG